MKFRPVCIAGQTTEVSREKCRCCTDAETIRTVILDFGQIPVDSTAVKSLNIRNDTCNEEFYEVNRDPTNSLDAFFHFNKYSWSLVPSSATTFQIRYNPLIANEKSVDYFTIVNRNRTILKLIVRGTSIGPNASISFSELSMVCAPNEIAKKRVKITNDSDVPANFTFDIDETQSSFKPEPMNGSIGANSHTHIVITFAPKIKGYQVCLLPCLIHHQAPIMIRLYGYCRKEHRREKDFNTTVLVYPPEGENGFKTYMWARNRMRALEEKYPYLSDPISLSNDYIDFGRFDTSKPMTRESPHTTCFTNHNLTDVSIKWDDDVDGIFSLEPNNARVNAGEVCLIEARFNPKEKNTFYGRELKALVCFLKYENEKPESIFRQTMIISLRLIGHTFSADSSSWIPQYQVPRTIIMPPCLPSSPVYSTFAIKRFGHLPLMFRFIPPLESFFAVKPMQGIISKNDQVIVVEMFPKVHDKLLYERWAIRFNGNPDYETFVDFRGYAEYPCLSFSEEFIQLPLTHPGCEQFKHVSMHNPTRHQINYRFENIPSELRIDQIEGQIYSNEIVTHKWIFCPLNEGDYELSVSCSYFVTRSSTSGNSEMIMEIKLSFIGKCEPGYILATPSELNFGELSYNESKKLSFELSNPGTVEIPYELTLKDQNWPYEETNLHKRVQLDTFFGNLFPGDKNKIGVTLVPRKRDNHEISIRYSIRKNCQSDCLISGNEPFEICRITYFCHLPEMKIEDLLYYGMGHKISKYVLWHLLKINELNRILNDLQPGESDELTMNVPPMTKQDDPSIVKFFISNPSSAVVNWSFRQIKVCSCSKMREKSGLNFHHMKYNCVHRKLCTFSPKSGILEDHEKTIITMELRYEILGETAIKWELDVGHDRHVSLFININCLSLLEQKAFLLYGPTVKLDNIYIGDRDPVNQIFWIYNPTKNDISYSLDTSALKIFNETHRDDIFHCINPSGIVKEFPYEPVIVKFRPRKLGLLEVTVPLTIGKEKTEITIRGECTNDPLAKITEAIPHHDLFRISEIPVHFSTDNVTLPSMPLHGRATRMIMIHNRLEHELVAYKWKKYEIPGILKIDVEPETGRIQPGSLQTFRLIIVTGGKPCIMNGQVTCEFINQSKKRAYERSVLLYKKLCDQMKDYFEITEKGTTYPKPREMILEEPKPFFKVLTVGCYIYSPQDEKIKILPNEFLKNTPAIEIPIDKRSERFFASRETIALSTFILEGMIWDILQNPNICKPSKSVLKYSQMAMKPFQRQRAQDRSYVRPSGRMMEKLLENMIFMIVHKEFALDMFHLTRKYDARQAKYPKIWQPVPGQEGEL